MLSQQVITFMGEDKAKALALANQAADPDWTYVAMKSRGPKINGEASWIVSIVDEEGKFLGTL